MKLPGINYNTPVQSLGRQNPGGPLMVANAQAGALNTLASAARTVAKSMEITETATSAAGLQIDMARMNAAVQAKKNYTTAELNAMGVKYDTKQYGNGEGQSQTIPAYKVAPKVYEKMSKELFDKHSAGTTSQKGQLALSNMYGRMYQSGASSVIKSSIDMAYSVRSTEMESSFDAAVNSGNLDASMIISDAALDSGIWSPEKHLAKTKGMPNKIATGKYMVALDEISDPFIMESMMTTLLADPALDLASKSSLYGKFGSKLKEVQGAISKEITESGRDKSYKSFVDTSTMILEYDAPLGWDEVNSIASGMEYVDGKALLTLNKMMISKTSVTDPQEMMRLSVLVNSISLPREGTDIYRRREDAVNQLMAAAGYDPATGKQKGASKVSPADFSALWTKINKSQSFAYDNPEVVRMVDTVWQMLTGGSKDIMTRFFGAGPDTINALDAESKMLEAAREMGPSFNPDEWWASNSPRFLTRTIEENEKGMRKSRLDKFVVKDINSPGGINVNATMRTVAKLIKDKTITDKYGKEIMQQTVELQRLNEQRIEARRNQ